MKRMMMLLLMVLPLAGFGADYYFLIPAAAHATGAYETNWRTDLDLYYPSGPMVFIDISLLPPDIDNSTPTTIHQALGATQVLTFPDILQKRFTYEGAAALLIHADQPDVQAASRTYNDLTSSGKGTYGQYIPGFAQDELLSTGDTASIILLRKGTSYRTNFGVASMTSTSITVTVKWFDQIGTPKGTQTLTLPPNGFHQISDIFTLGDMSNLSSPYITVTCATQGALYMAYASVIDNTSGDAIFVPAKK